jgi:hypothetical protein
MCAARAARAARRSFAARNTFAIDWRIRWITRDKIEGHIGKPAAND